jgi:hypothetical protein
MAVSLKINSEARGLDSVNRQPGVELTPHAQEIWDKVPMLRDLGKSIPAGVVYSVTSPWEASGTGEQRVLVMTSRGLETAAFAVIKGRETFQPLGELTGQDCLDASKVTSVGVICTRAIRYCSPPPSPFDFARSCSAQPIKLSRRVE